jgi:hypothetical protein
VLVPALSGGELVIGAELVPRAEGEAGAATAFVTEAGAGARRLLMFGAALVSGPAAEFVLADALVSDKRGAAGFLAFAESGGLLVAAMALLFVAAGADGLAAAVRGSTGDRLAVKSKASVPRRTICGFIGKKWLAAWV